MIFIRFQDPEFRRFPFHYRNGGNGDIGFFGNMVVKHASKIHLVQLIA